MGVRLWNMLCGGVSISTAAATTLTTVASATERTVHRLRQGVWPRHGFDLWQVELERI